jgi:hypothetical protein
MNENNFLAGSYYQNNYTQEQNNQFAQIFDGITKEMVSCMEQGLSYDADEMQAAVRKHYEFCLRFWEPNRDSYKSLAMSYILPTGYRDSYESYKIGLGKYIYDAVVHFADNNLS